MRAFLGELETRPRRLALRPQGQRPQSAVCLSPRPQIAVRLLAHKIQSPQEWEAVQALTVGPRWAACFTSAFPPRAGAEASEVAVRSRPFGAV